jgi:hypothetical protein
MSPIGILTSGSFVFRCMFDDQLRLLPQLVPHAEHVDAQLLLRPLRPRHGGYGNILKIGNCGVTPLDVISIRARLSSMDQFSIIDENKVMFCVEKQNKYCFKYLAMFCSRKPNFAYNSQTNVRKNIYVFCLILQLVHS